VNGQYRKRHWSDSQTTMVTDDNQKNEPAETTRPTIVYKKFEQSRLAEIVSVVVAHFFPNNGIFKTCHRLEGGQPEDHRGWIAAILATWPWEGCLMAVDAATDRVVGVSISLITEPDSPNAFQAFMESGSEVSLMFVPFMAELQGDYDVFKALGVKRVLYRVMTTVDAAYHRQGIAGELFRRTTHESAPAAGCEAVTGISISNFTERCWRKLHYQEVSRLDVYDSTTMTSNPKVELSRCGEHRTAILMVLKLGA